MQVHEVVLVPGLELAVVDGRLKLPRNVVVQVQFGRLHRRRHQVQSAISLTIDEASHVVGRLEEGLLGGLVGVRMLGANSVVIRAMLRLQLLLLLLHHHLLLLSLHQDLLVQRMNLHRLLIDDHADVRIEGGRRLRLRWPAALLRSVASSTPVSCRQSIPELDPVEAWLLLLVPRKQVVGLLVHGNHLPLIISQLARIVAIDLVFVPLVLFQGVVHDLATGILNHLLANFSLVLVFSRCERSGLLAHFSVLLHQELVCSPVLASRHLLRLLHFLLLLLIRLLVVGLNGAALDLQVPSELLNLLDEVAAFARFGSAGAPRA